MSNFDRGDRSTAPALQVGARSMVLHRPLLMGVVNASPESFSDAGTYQSLSQRVELCAELIEQGADIIDVGGQSAITNQPELDASLEADRVVPIVEWLRSNHPDTLVSVDTYKPTVVKAVLEAGAAIINDVSGLRFPEVAGMTAEHSAALVIMHTAAAPKVRLQRADLYADVTREVVDFLRASMARAIEAGMSEDALILDPGPDFTKTPFQTIDLLRHLDDVRALGRPVLLALSRKDFLGAITGRSPRGREAATHAALAFFAAQPGGIMRVHDVAAARDVVATMEVLSGLREIDPEYLLPDSIRHEPTSRHP